MVLCSAVQCSAIQSSTIECSVVYCSVVQCSVEQYGIVQYSVVQGNLLSFITVQGSVMQVSAVQMYFSKFMNTSAWVKKKSCLVIFLLCTPASRVKRCWAGCILFLYYLMTCIYMVPKTEATCKGNSGYSSLLQLK